MIASLRHYPPNPDYGDGIFRRRLRFLAEPGRVRAQVDDTHHCFWLILDHEDGAITSVAADFLRAPTTVCQGAVAGLSALIGRPLAGPASMEGLPQVSNCSHLVDLAHWAMRHIAGSTTWDIIVPDETDRPAAISIARDGVIVHAWEIADFAVVSPSQWRGFPLLRGFWQWAREQFEGELLMAALMLQRGVFVAKGRRYLVDQNPPTPLKAAAGMAGMCWAYAGDRLDSATSSIGYVRDFSDGVIPGMAPEDAGPARAIALFGSEQNNADGGSD